MELLTVEQGPVSLGPVEWRSPGGILPVGEELFVGDDVERLHAVIAENFAPHALRVIEDHPINGRFQTCHQGKVSLYLLGYGADVEIGPDELPDFYMVNVPFIGNGLVVVDRHEVRSAPSVVGPGQRLRMRKSADSTTLVVRIARDTLDKALHGLLGEQPTTPVRFVAPVDIRNDDAQQWMALARAVAGTADTGLLSRSPLAASHFEQLLVHGLLGFQPPYGRSEALTGVARPAAPTALHRAMRFCEEHAGQPISVVDIAVAARVSVRTLQDNFRSYAQTTPLGYLRRVRLDRAHQDLLAATESGRQTTVTEIALRWGFVHLSRFAQFYRDTYGRLPSESLSAQRGTHRTLSG